MGKRLAGTIQLTVNGVTVTAKGDFSYNLGKAKREGMPAADGTVPGYKETTQVPYIEGNVQDSADVDLEAFVTADDVAVSLLLANGKTIYGESGWFAGEGTVSTGEGEIPARWEFSVLDEV